jgi:exosortase A-associated hydrolase 2
MGSQLVDSNLLKGHFIESLGSKCFLCQFGHLNDAADNAVLLLPALFEEMNLSRAIVAKQAQFLAFNGWAVYCLDYFGTGDSDGEIEQATANIWLENIIDATDWLAKQGVPTLNIWGIRAGALLAFQSLSRCQAIMPVSKLLLWKPVLKGKLFVSQFLRLKKANSMIQGGEKTNWRQKVAQGVNIEVAGYKVSDALLSSLEALQIPKDYDGSTPVAWLELAAKVSTPAIDNLIKEWPQECLHFSCIDGSSFWQVPELFEQAFLHQATYEALGSH